MQFINPVPDVAVEGDNDHVQIHDDARNLLGEMAEADLQSGAEVAETLAGGWVFRLFYDVTAQAYPARNPGAKYHDYIGPVQPTDMVPGDSWADYSAS